MIITYLNSKLCTCVQILIVSIMFISCQQKDRNTLDLSGEWTVRLDSLDDGEVFGWYDRDFDQVIQLPGTMDDAGLGIPNTLEPRLEKPQLLYLTRKNSYLGAAWYSREVVVPKDWLDKQIRLSLERVIWQTKVWVDGVKVEQIQNSLIAPHIYDLTAHLIPGKKQRITIQVDNRKQFDTSVNDLAHAYTNHTQIIWNGIIGDIKLQAFDPVFVADVFINPDLEENIAHVDVSIENTFEEAAVGYLEIQARHKSSGKRLHLIKDSIEIPVGSSVHSLDYLMGEDVKCWSEHSPELYELQVAVITEKTTSSKNADFGMRAFERKGSQLTINGRPLFLRGTLECNIFPLTGYPPMTQSGWMKVFKTAKAWGLNHLRFHSWCPPKAAFQAADQMGFYLQVELPVWTLNVGESASTVDFMYAEADRIIREYGNHPSFCMWSMGNELQGDMSILENLVKYLKAKDKRHLYTTTSFTFEPGHGIWPEPEDDFFVTQWTHKGWVRGQGVFNDWPPAFNTDYVKSIEGAQVPIITHEIGQYAVYPNLDEIPKYTGVLLPLNFLAVKADLEQKGMIEKAQLFTQASGKLASILYKEEIERAIKTDGISGFQLLDLHDFPGQGTALVGLLDVFWDNKGIISPEEFRYACNDVVPLIRFPKAVYTTRENFDATVDMSNFSDQDLKGQVVEWQLMNGTQIIQSGSFTVDLKLGYNADLHEISVPLDFVQQASKLTVRVSLKNLPYQNQWNFWVYPDDLAVDFGKVKYTRKLDEASHWLEMGETVLYNPDYKSIQGIEGRFVPVFWSPVHFPKQAATMGILCNPAHAAFAQFPTDMHTNWQWWDIIKHSTTVIFDGVQGGSPLVEVVDNFVNNRRLAMIYEGKVGEGKVLFASCDLSTNIEERPAARQLLVSLLEYMNSEKFNPDAIVSFGQVVSSLK
ncbi:MAG: glycoside hydrolase family 2 [Bacteroidales bacterium]|jgi:hypothetical protein|nr:glycoside hydrolase family 2 [Bacteroidales bacterium]